MILCLPFHSRARSYSSWFKFFSTYNAIDKILVFCFYPDKITLGLASLHKNILKAIQVTPWSPATHSKFPAFIRASIKW